MVQQISEALAIIASNFSQDTNALEPITPDTQGQKTFWAGKGNIVTLCLQAIAYSNCEWSEST